MYQEDMIFYIYTLSAKLNAITKTTPSTKFKMYDQDLSLDPLFMEKKDQILFLMWKDQPLFPMRKGQPLFLLYHSNHYHYEEEKTILGFITTFMFFSFISFTINYIQLVINNFIILGHLHIFDIQPRPSRLNLYSSSSSLISLVASQKGINCKIFS